MKKLLSILALVPALAFAWQPTKPITVVLPVAPGSGQEMSFRYLSAQVEKEGKAKFVFEYKAGADGNIGMNHFADQSNDGHTIALPSCQSTYVSSEIWYKDMIKFDPMEFEIVTNIGKSPLVFVARTNSKVNTVPEIIADIKNGNRNINFSIGGAAHRLAFEYLMDKVNGDAERVKPILYKGPLPAITDVAAGHTEFGVVPVAVANPLIQAGKVKVIGLASEKPMGLENNSLMKDYIPGLNVYACWNIVLPKGTAPEVVKWYEDTFVPVVKSAEAKKFYEQNFVFIDERILGSKATRQDLIKLRNQWQPYVRKMPAPQ